jgi:hypothetical protein
LAHPIFSCRKIQFALIVGMSLLGRSSY